MSTYHRRMNSAGARARGPLIGHLLAHAATGVPLPAGEWGGRADHERQLQWALAGGLGPLLHRALREAPAQATDAWTAALHGAELTARVRHAQHADTVVEVIEAGQALGVELVLLKGVSTADLYPSPHCRPMGDIDLLVAGEGCEALQRALLQRGYIEALDAFPDDLHHAAPLRHPVRGAVVELHTNLFPSGSPLAAGQVFSGQRVVRESVPSFYAGRPVRRLPAELQLAYAASTWVDDITFRKSQPGFLPSLFDGVYLLSRSEMDWEKLLRHLDNAMAMASLMTMLAYVSRFGVPSAPAVVMRELASRQRLLGALQLRLMHFMLDRYLVAGRPWTLPLPPPVPGRYNLRRQWEKRVLRRG